MDVLFVGELNDGTRGVKGEDLRSRKAERGELERSGESGWREVDIIFKFQRSSKVFLDILT